MCIEQNKSQEVRLQEDKGRIMQTDDLVSDMTLKGNFLVAVQFKIHANFRDFKPKSHMSTCELTFSTGFVTFSDEMF